MPKMPSAPSLPALPGLPSFLRFGRGADEDGAPDWVVVDLRGSYPTYHAHDAVLSLLQRAESFEALTERLDRLARAGWVRGVLVRVSGLTAGLATSHAIGRALGRLAEHKRVVAYLEQVSLRTLLAATGASEVVAPESAEVMVPGLAAEQTFYGAFLRRRGIEFENLRIKEYKAALTRFSEEGMDEHNREQLTTYLESAERSWLQTVRPDGGAELFAAGLTNAHQLLEAGLIDRVAYDDEVAVPVDQHWGRTLELLRDQVSEKRRTKKTDRIAVIPVIGAIVSGRSRGTPPLPLMPGPLVGSDTVVTAIRRAERDEHTAAIVLVVDSGGGSALASDLIGRAVARCTKPVVAVMVEVAGSGGYYVLAQADHVVADPFTITGSIGVVIGKPVLTEFNERHGLNPEVVGRAEALFESPNRRFSDAERAWAETMMNEVYDRFVDRVAAGRGLSRERVDEIGRGRIWSGADAHELGLVDELGDLHTALAAARRLAKLPDDAPVHTVSAGLSLPGVPTFGKEPAAALAALWPFGRERVLLWMDTAVTVRG